MVKIAELKLYWHQYQPASRAAKEMDRAFVLALLPCYALRAFVLALLPCYAFAAPASDAVPKLPGWDKPLHNYASASGMRSQ